MATANNGLAAVFFAPSTVTARVGKGVEVTITEKTKYPFDETIEFRFSMSKSVAFPFLMRVPGWCEKPKVFINGKEISFDSKPLSWIILERMWKEGDEVRLELPQTVTVKVWRKNNNAVSVHRGPLTYSLKIGERWHKYGGTEEFPAFEVLPTTPWNYGLVVDTKNPSASFDVVKKEYKEDAQPFTLENTPIELKAKGKRIAKWKQESNGLVGALQYSPVR